ncbi:MAG: SRPBCC domain-containing protein [Clostridia bacterium]|nr:SRPBCC domain-containing protein [Clostridia bacterium]
MAEAWDLALLKLKEVCERNLAPFTPITLTIHVRVPLESAWACWNSAECVRKWNHASDDWHCPAAANDLRVGGRYVYTMAARDGSASFDFAGTYTEIVPGERITSQLDDGRMVRTVFEAVGPDRTRIVETFEAEHEYPLDRQREGWQAILDNFRKTMESDK